MSEADKPEEKPAKAPKIKPVAKAEVKEEKPAKSSAEEITDSKRGTKLRKAIEYISAAKCSVTCPEGAAGEAVNLLLNQAIAKVEAALAVVES